MSFSVASSSIRRAAFVAACIAANCGHAALIVNAPRPIEYQVKVQLIRTAHDDGSPLATALGSASQRAYIEDRVNDIWAQAGIQVDFADSITRLNSTTAYGGAADLHQLTSLGNAAGVLSTDVFTLNLFLVNKVPGFTTHPDNSAAGLAWVGGNGIAMFVGTDLLGYNGGRDAIAHVAAHEIGHNLGLTHVAGSDNLLNGSGGTEKLTLSQVAVALNSFYVQPLPVLQGDFNGDGRVDAADYTAWRDGLGSLYGQQDYRDWLANFGATRDSLAAAPEAAPEPTALALLLFVSAGLLVIRR